jgi:hypothetical protein
MRRKAKIVAVLGSLAALGGGTTAIAATSNGQSPSRAHASDAGSPPALANLTSGEQTALEAVRTAITADTSSIATPILDKAVSAGTITSAQETALLTMLEQGPPMGPGTAGGHPMGPPPSSG